MLTADTPFFYPQEGDDAVAYHKSQALEGRLTDIKDIAPLVDFLCHDRWITGQVIFCKRLISTLTDDSKWRLHHSLEAMTNDEKSGECRCVAATALRRLTAHQITTVLTLPD